MSWGVSKMEIHFDTPLTLGAPGYPISSSCARNPDEYLPHTCIVLYIYVASTQQASWHKRLSFG